MDSEPIRIGILGAARIAPGALIEPARARDDVRVVSVAARDPARAKAFAAEHGLDDFSASYGDLIARDDLDLIYCALPPDVHCRWTIAALEAGKAVLCEKPFALGESEARAMAAAAQRSGRTLIEGFHYRFHRMMRDAVALVSAGELGRIISAHVGVEYPIPRREGEPRWSRAHGGGALMDLGCYGVHALRSVLRSEPEVDWAAARMDLGVDVSTAAQLSFPGNVRASFFAAMDPPAPRTELIVIGTLGRLDIGGFVLPQRMGRSRITTGGVARDLPTEGPSSYAAQLDHVVAVLRGRERQLTGGEDAVCNMRAIEAIKRACAPAAGSPTGA